MYNLECLLNNLWQRKVFILKSEDALLQLAKVHQIVDEILQHALAKDDII